MIRLHLLLFGLTFTCSTPYPRWKDDHIIYFVQDFGRPDGYSFGYQTEFGNSRNEKANLRTNSRGIKYFEVTGSYAYNDDRGVRHNVDYVSDDRGYRLVKPLNIINDNIKFEAKFQGADYMNNDNNKISNTITNIKLDPKVRPKFISTIDYDEIQFIDDPSTTTSTEQSTTVSSTISSLDSTMSPEDDMTTTTLMTTTPVNDTLLKAGEKVPAVQYDEEGVGNRVGLPPGLIGSLLGG